ncbi:MAG: alpha/beta hydrolase [Pseudomonadota bacterium]
MTTVPWSTALPFTSVRAARGATSQKRAALYPCRTGLLFVLLILGLSACTGRPTLTPAEDKPFLGATTEVYFVTTRAPSGTASLYSGTRSNTASFGRVDVGIPSDRELGDISTTDGIPDPAKHFHQRGIYRYRSFDSMRNAALTSSDSEGLSLFVHGYNNTFPESVFRLAQLQHDANQPGAAIAFQWASMGDPGGYVHDRDSAMHARRTLAATIEGLSRGSSERLRLGAHSMGSLLLMEALVRLSLEGQASLLRGIDEIVLISPDIDLAVFAQQLADIDLPASRFSVVINQEDKLLRLSSVISGGNARAGASPDVTGLRSLGVQVFDLTGLEDGDRPGHFLPATSPMLLSIIRDNSASGAL